MSEFFVKAEKEVFRNESAYSQLTSEYLLSAKLHTNLCSSLAVIANLASR